MASIRSEDSGIVYSQQQQQHQQHLGISSGNNNQSEGLRRPSQVSFSQASETHFALGRGGGDTNNTSINNATSNVAVMMDDSNIHTGGSPGSSPSRSRRSVWREVINSVRTNRELLVDSFVRTSIVHEVGHQNQNQNRKGDEAATAAREEYPAMDPTFIAHPESRLTPQRVITVNKPNAMRNRALTCMAIALSTLTVEMLNESHPPSEKNRSGGCSPISLPVALQESPHATNKTKTEINLPTSPVVPTNREHPNKPTRLLAPVTVEDITMDGKVPLDVLSKPMMTLFEAQDTLQKCIGASSVLNGKFEVKVAPASVLLVDTEDDWGTNFEIAPRRLAYKASELEEALSDVLRRRGVALVFFDKKTLIEGMRQDDLGADEDEDDEANAKMQALLNAPLNEDGTVSHGFEGTSNAADSSQNGNSLFNGSFSGLGGGRGAPIAMQALRTRRTDIREADCGFVLGPTRQAESVALAVTQWNRERDELELVYTEVTATALLDAMSMRSAQTGRPQGFLALMPLQELSVAMHASNNNTNGPTSSTPLATNINTANNSTPSPGSQSPQENPILGASSGMVVGGPNIPALEVVSQSAVTLDCVFPTFASLAQYHCDEIEQSNKNASRIPLGHIDHSIATHITSCSVGTAAITGSLDKGLPINDIVNSVNLSDVHMSVESDGTLQVHEVFSYMLQYSLKNPSAQLDVEWCPVVQTVHRANAAATVSVEQLCETLQLVRDASSAEANNNNNPASPICKKPLNVAMIAKVRIDIAVGTHGNSITGTGGGTRWLVICGYNEDSATVTVLDPAPKRFGLFWSVSVEQLHRALTGHGYIILSNKQNTIGKSSADYIVCRPETHQIVLQTGISYDSPDAVLPMHSQLPPRPIARCPLSLAACAIARVTGANLTFSQFLRSLPHPTPYGFTEDISLAHFAHVTRTFCHENKLPIHMTLCHLSVDAQGARAVDEKQFSERLQAAAASTRHAVIVNYGVTAFSSSCRPDRGTGAFALLLGFIPQDGKFNRYDRVLLQDCSDYVSQQVFSVEVNELYRACCDVCTVSRRTMGFIDLRFVGDEESVTPVASLSNLADLSQNASASQNSNLSGNNNPSNVSISREQNVSVALEGNLATSNWEAVAISRHPELPRHMFKSVAIPILTAASSALVSLGLSCAEADLIAANFATNSAETKYEHLPTVLQAKPPTLNTARTLINAYLEFSSSSSTLKLLPQEKTNLLSALQAMKKHPKDVRIILQYDCRVVHSTIRKFVSAGVVSAVKGGGELALIRVLEAETASFLDVWEARAGSLMKTFDDISQVQEQQSNDVDQNPITTGVLVLYRSNAVNEEIFSENVVDEASSPVATSITSLSSTSDKKRPDPLVGRRNSPPPVSMVTSPPASPMMSHASRQQQQQQQQGGEDNNTGAAASGNNNRNVGAARMRAMPYSLNTKKF